MYFALPPRKTSKNLPYHGEEPSHFSVPRRLRFRTILYGVVVVLITYILLRPSIHLKYASKHDRIPPGTPEVVLVTTMFHVHSEKFDSMVRINRQSYANRHGYATFFANSTAYDLSEYSSPNSWAKIPSMRHAMTAFPHSRYFWYLSEEALIARPDLSLEKHILDPQRLQEIMIEDVPVVPPDSVIKTWSGMLGSEVDFVVTQDTKGLSVESFVLKRGEYAKFLLDSWFDPLYRAYNFQHAERHALEHLVQWHGTILAKLALVPQKLINAYEESPSDDEQFMEGDFVIHFKECNKTGRECEMEMEPVFTAIRRKTEPSL